MKKASWLTVKQINYWKDKHNTNLTHKYISNNILKLYCDIYMKSVVLILFSQRAPRKSNILFAEKVKNFF